MMPLLLRSKPFTICHQKWLESQLELFKNKGRMPGLSIVQVGNDSASSIYTQIKQKKALELGYHVEYHRFQEEIGEQKELENYLQKANLDPKVDGILVQLPLPKTWNFEPWRHIDPSKDVDGFHPYQMGLGQIDPSRALLSCTAKGILQLLDFYQIPLDGKIAVVVGRSKIVGKPLADLLLSRNATLIHCHRGTNDLKSMTLLGDLVFIAIGQMQSIDGSYFKKDAIVIDVGIHQSGPALSVSSQQNSKQNSNKASKAGLNESTNQSQKSGIVGDVDFSLVSHLKAYTPVPGGVGPMTISMLMENVFLSSAWRQGIQIESLFKESINSSKFNFD